MTHTELREELRLRNEPHSASDNVDLLRVKLYAARAALLDRRNEHVLRAEKVLHEVDQYSSAAFLSDSSLDTILADDNAIYAAALSRRLLGLLRVQAVVGTVLGVVLCSFMPLGKIEQWQRLLPIPFSPSAIGYASVSLANAALLGALQAVTQYLRRVFHTESFFGQKLAAVTCREGIIEWMTEAEDTQIPGAARTARLFRHKTVIPVLSMAAGRYICLPAPCV
ncbi:hypothetical protein AB1Y20_020121 [Prymnesium parvum]|uniref:Uncharacterized protein n=1 Tax=Prymnesium parvum TaxID=97485 RepID=A0AB34JX22_PRYPA